MSIVTEEPQLELQLLKFGAPKDIEGVSNCAV
jgi:hypothetical protein